VPSPQTAARSPDRSRRAGVRRAREGSSDTCGMGGDHQASGHPYSDVLPPTHDRRGPRRDFGDCRRGRRGTRLTTDVCQPKLTPRGLGTIGIQSRASRVALAGAWTGRVRPHQVRRHAPPLTLGRAFGHTETGGLASRGTQGSSQMPIAQRTPRTSDQGVRTRPRRRRTSLTLSAHVGSRVALTGQVRICCRARGRSVRFARTIGPSTKTSSPGCGRIGAWLNVAIARW
jgi:hypothetical protein